jgi:hypothetical protein
MPDFTLYRYLCDVESVPKTEWRVSGDTPTFCKTDPAHGISEVASIETQPATPAATAEGVLLTQAQVQSVGLEMCDRDILIKTAVLDVAAALTVNGADANGHVDYTAKTLGIQGNDLTVEHAVGATGAGNENRALDAVATPGLTTAIKVTFGTDGAGASITPTAQQVADAVNASATAAPLVTAAAQGTGASDAGTVAATAMTGGVTNSLEDVKINPLTFVKGAWKELALVGCYKDDGAGGYTPCTSAQDATDNACLSVWRYCSHSHVSGLPAAIEIRDGHLIVDANISDSLDHQAYAIAAPQIPAAMGGAVVQFDAYLKFYAGKTLGATSPSAKALDPTGPGGAAAGELRVYIYYPKLTAFQHILRLVTYRPGGTF